MGRESAPGGGLKSLKAKNMKHPDVGKKKIEGKNCDHRGAESQNPCRKLPSGTVQEVDRLFLKTEINKWNVKKKGGEEKRRPFFWEKKLGHFERQQ